MSSSSARIFIILLTEFLEKTGLEKIPDEKENQSYSSGKRSSNAYFEKKFSVA